jgi:hypothetical protein
LEAAASCSEASSCLCSRSRWPRVCSRRYNAFVQQLSVHKSGCEHLDTTPNTNIFVKSSNIPGRG